MFQKLFRRMKNTGSLELALKQRVDEWCYGGSLRKGNEQTDQNEKDKNRQKPQLLSRLDIIFEFLKDSQLAHVEEIITAYRESQAPTPTLIFFLNL